MRKKQTKPYLMMLSAMFIFGTQGVFRKYVPLSSAMLAFFRGSLGGIFLLIVSALTKRKLFQPVQKKTLLKVIFTGVLMGINWISLFEAYRYTTVATATLCYYIAPTLLILISPLVFKERLTVRKTACAAVALCGMVLVSGILESGISGNTSLTGVFFSLCGAVLDCSIVICNKKTEMADIYQKTIIQLFSAAAILVPYLILTEDFSVMTFTPLSVGMILIIGFVHTGLSYYLFYSSMSGLRAQSIAVLSYVDPITAVFVSALVLNEPMSILGWIGAVLIIGAAVVSEIQPGASEYVQN